MVEAEENQVKTHNKSMPKMLELQRSEAGLLCFCNPSFLAPHSFSSDSAILRFWFGNPSVVAPSFSSGAVLEIMFMEAYKRDAPIAKNHISNCVGASR